MMATMEQTQTELPRLVELAQRGEEVVITQHGLPVAKITGLHSRQRVTQADRVNWLAELADLRRRTATGKTHPTIEEILDEDRGN
ncbi:MAG: type II toxin-antitoxin system prevent-host-death family antitoxin [Verrucomicrobiota bacterium]